MAKGPLSHGKTREEVVREVLVFLMRIKRRRQRFESSQRNLLGDARRYVVEAVAADVAVEEVALLVGYGSETVSRWAAKHRSLARGVSEEVARRQLDRIHRRRQRSKAEASKTADKARSVVRTAVEMGITAEVFADLTGYNLETVDRWYASASKALEQVRRQRELASIRRTKRNRPPQHLSPEEAKQWLLEEYKRRFEVLRGHGLEAGASGSPTSALVPRPRTPLSHEKR